MCILDTILEHHGKRFLLCCVLVFNREVGEVYAGVLIATRVQSDCRCPPAAPRVNPLDTRYCMSNGVSSSVANTVLRISDMSHPLQYANDDDVNSVWISKFQQNVTLEVDLGDQFEVHAAQIKWMSSFCVLYYMKKFLWFP